MSKLNPESGDIFMVSDIFPILVVRLNNILSGIFLTFDGAYLTTESSGFSEEDLTKRKDIKFLFKLDCTSFERFVMEKQKLGEFDNVSQDK